MSCTNSCTNSNETKDALLQVWGAGFDAYCKAYYDGISQTLANFRRMALHKFTLDCVRHARLNDETVYVKLLELMGVYKKIVLEGRIDGGLKPEAKTLLDGVCDVLVSRVSQFFAKFPSGLGSPVRTEKIQIIEESAMLLAEKIDDAVPCFPKPESRLHSLHDLSAREAIEIPAENVEIIFCLYTDELLACLTKLDDLHFRKVAGYFMDLLEREWEELGNIIKVQVGALEERSEENAAKDPVAKVLFMLREVYQQLGPVIEEYKNLFASGRPHPKSFILKSDFFAFAEGLLFNIGFDGEQFMKLLHDEVKSQAGKLAAEFAKATYKVKRLVSGDVLLCDEIALTFGQLLDKLPVSPLQEAEAILQGIQETIKIKISSLRESMAEFEESSETHIKELGRLSQSFEISSELAESIVESVKASWLSSQPDDTDKFFEACLNGDEYLPAKEQIEKIINSQMLKVEKSLLVFKKEVLLYELCTFEEILTYSVPKLECSDCELTKKAAAMLRDVFKELEVILKKNNISVIRPNIHSEFNAKEHEVLVAEKHDGFAKGEIIKVLTAGYLYKDSVILRSNVVAAR